GAGPPGVAAGSDPSPFKSVNERGCDSSRADGSLKVWANAEKENWQQTTRLLRTIDIRNFISPSERSGMTRQHVVVRDGERQNPCSRYPIEDWFLVSGLDSRLYQLPNCHLREELQSTGVFAYTDTFIGGRKPSASSRRTHNSARYDKAVLRPSEF